MKLYLIHRAYYLNYLEAQHRLEQILNEQEEMLARVEPKSTLANHEREHMASNPPATGTRTNKTEEYVIEAEKRHIADRLKVARQILQDRELLLKQKEAEIRKSKDIYNVVYVAKYIDGVKADRIYRDTEYSRSQIYNIIGHLKKQMERDF